jgi:hypothetical protein
MTACALALPVLLLLSAGSARADLWQITFNGDLSGSGSFTTDGTCVMCSNLLGTVETFTASLGPNTGTSAFDTTDGLILFNRSTGSLLAPLLVNGNALSLIGNDWTLFTLNGISTGTYSVADPRSIPEPATGVMLSMLLLGFVGWRTARQKA